MLRLPGDLSKITAYKLSRWRDRIDQEIDILCEELERIDDYVEGNKEKFGNDGIDYSIKRLEAA